MSSSNQNEKKYDNKNIANGNNKLNINEIKLIQRTIVNNTHEVLEDKRIKSITSWRKSKTKFYQNLIFNILSFGILHLISLHYPYLYIKLYCNPWPAKECDFFLVENIYGQYTLCIKNYKKSKSNNFSINSDLIEEKVISSPLINHKITKYNIAKNLTYSFKYNSMNYEYNLDTNEIIPVYMNLSKMTNKGILEYFSEGLSYQNIVLKFEERFGKNEYCINPYLLSLYFKKVEAPSFIIIILVGIAELVLKDYVSFIIKILFILIIFFFQFIFARNIAYKIYNNEITLDGKNKIRVKRKYLMEDKNDLFTEINNRDLLPGDIIYLKLNDIVPCDCLIIEGECLINQADLNGDLGIFKKISLLDNNEQFNYQKNQINILLHGMKIIKIFSKIKEGYISVLCINTGPNTYKANLYSNILYSEMKKGYQNIYKFFGDDRKKMYILIIILFIGSILLGFTYIYVLKMQMHLEVLKKLIASCIIRSLFKSFMPVYFITHSMILVSNLYNLKQQNIFCFDKCRLLHTYNIKTIFFSKANILCENTLEVCSYNPININIQKHGMINYRTYKENQWKELNIQLLKYYNDYIFKTKYQINKTEKTKRESCGSLILKDYKINESKFNKETYHFTVLLLECLLSCNNLEKINNEIFGNTIEVKIFNNFKWDMKTYDSNYYNEENKNNNSNGNNTFFCELKREKTKYDFDNDSNLVDKKISDIFPMDYYKMTETLKMGTKSQNKWRKLKTKYFNNFNLKKTELNNDNLKAPNNININPILEDLSKTDINSYKLRIYKRFIKNGTLISSAIVYNFLTKELRFMTKGIPEDLLNKCDNNSLPENFDKTISLIRRNGYIVIICATKLIDLDEYNDLCPIDYYMNKLTFCGFITLRNTPKNEVKNSINDLKIFNCNLLISSGDELYNCLSVGFNSSILDNKNIYTINKDDNNKIVFKKILNIKNEEDNENSESEDKYSGQTSIKNIGDSIYKNDYSYNQNLSNKYIINYNNKKKNQQNKFKLSNKIKKDGFIDCNSSLERFNNINMEVNVLRQNNKSIKKKKYLETKKYEKNKSINKSNEYENKRLSNFYSRNYSIRELSIESKNEKSKQSRNDYYYNEKNKNNKKPNVSYKNKFRMHLEKHYYYPKIFIDFEELTSNCIYCINGKTFNYLYKNKSKKEYKILMKQIYNNCKIFYKMSSIDKSLAVDFFGEFENNCVCYIGKTKSDSDAILSSSIGIDFETPRNQNTILSHFYLKEIGILCIKNLILQGKSIHENVIFLKISSIFCTMVIISFILCCFICHIDVMIGQLNALEISLLIFSIGGFTSKHNTYLKKNPFVNNPKSFTKFNYILTIGLFLIKLVSIYLLCSNIYNIEVPLEEYVKSSKIFCTFYFLLCMEFIFSSIFVYNYNSFNRRNLFENYFYLIFILIFFIYLLLLLTLSSSNYNTDIFQITNFEYSDYLIDSFSDRNKLVTLCVSLFDFSLSFIYSRIIYYIFGKLSKNKS